MTACARVYATITFTRNNVSQTLWFRSMPRTVSNYRSNATEQRRQMANTFAAGQKSTFTHICVCSSHTTKSDHTVKVAHTRLPSVGFRSWFRFLAVSLQVTWIINPAVGCHYFPPGPQLPSQPLRRLLPVLLLGEQRHDGREQFA